jgi:hypothetical protein
MCGILGVLNAQDRVGTVAMNNRSIDTAEHAVIDEAGVVERLAAQLTARYGQLPAPELLRAVIEREFPGEIAVVSSFGAESAVILSLVAIRQRPSSFSRPASIFRKPWPTATNWWRGSA